MKAWYCYSREEGEYYDAAPWAVVHAETRGKARSLAKGVADYWSGAEFESFVEIKAVRVPALDDLHISPWTILQNAPGAWRWPCQWCERECGPDWVWDGWSDEDYERGPVTDPVEWFVYCSDRCRDDHQRMLHQSCAVSYRAVLDSHAPELIEIDRDGWWYPVSRVVAYPWGDRDREEWRKLWRFERLYLNHHYREPVRRPVVPGEYGPFLEWRER